MKIKTISDIESFENKVVLLRVDYNVPLNENLEIQDDSRIQGSLETIKELRAKKAKIVLISHLGRPKDEVVENLRLTPVAKHLSSLLGMEVVKFDDIISSEIKDHIAKMNSGEICMLENIRFNPGEKKCEENFTKELASLGDIFVSDAFGTAHRKHSSTYGLSSFLPAYAGKLIQKEIEALSPATEGKIESPVTMIFGGAKIDTKIGVINFFKEKADYFIIGGGLANTFLKAQGHEVGSSLYEEEKIELAKEILKEMGDKLILPLDVVVSTEISTTAEAKTVKVSEVSSDEKILDMGPQTIKKFTEVIEKSKTIIWNGPLGLYEFPQFAAGSYSAAKAIANHQCNSIVGGGDTSDCIKKSGVDPHKFTHISTGGGACIEFLSGETLPGIEVLKA